ncbi:MAG TPA: hypothetical protein VFC29_02035, partial [Candidatus Limnocylindrales bacterium]|nr:hypothetical protein [Candidatus Limnocylindrales bacterium]
MKTQISGQHIDTIGVQPPTILNTKFSPGLLSRAFFILLLIATTVATGAAQSIYVSNIVQFGSGSLAYINEYGPDGTLVNDDMLVFGGGREVTGLAWSAGSLFVPILNTGFSDTVNKYNANTAATDLLFHFNAGSVTNPQGAAVFGNLLFIATNGVTGVYNATTGAQITLLGGVLFPQYVAVSPGPGGTVNVFVTQVDIYGSVPPPNSGAIHKYTVSSTGALISGPTTLVPNLNFPEGIAVSSDGKTVYVVIPQTFSNFNVGEIDAYDTTTGIGAPLIKNMSGVPWDIAVSASNLFVTLSTANAVGEYNFNTGVYNPSFISGSGSNADLNYPRGIALGVGGPCM